MNKMVQRTHRHLPAFFFLASLIAISLPIDAHAQGLKVPDLDGLIPATFTSLSSAVNVIWNTVVGVAGLAFLGYLLYGGFMFLTSSGDETLATKARHTLRDAVIGIALVVLAWPIGQQVLTILGQQGIIKDNPGLNVPTASSSTPLSSVSGNGNQVGSGNTGTTPPVNSNTQNTNTGTGNTGSIPPGTTGTQAPATASSVQPNTSFNVIQPGIPTQAIVTNQNGQASYTLNPSFEYADTELSFIKQTSGTAVGSLVVNINRRTADSSYQAMYGDVQVGSNGLITLKLPVDEMIRVTNASTGVEYLKDQIISSGSNGNNQQIKITVP